MSDMKTEVIVNGSWRASCDMCFQGIDEDTLSVRVLLFYCLWESTGHVHIHLLTLDLSSSSFKCSSSSIVVCCLFTCTDRPLLHVPSPSLYSFFSSSIDDGENWVRYLCVRQSIVHALARFFKCSYGRQCDKMNEKEADIDYDQFPLSLYVYNR
jgi:hypothetical protein